MGDLIIEKTISGDTVTFQSRIAAPIKSLKVDIMPIQPKTGIPSKDNKQPIYGWTGIDTVVCGENLFGNYNRDLFVTDGINVSVTNGRFIMNGICSLAPGSAPKSKITGLISGLDASKLYYWYGIPVDMDHLFYKEDTGTTYHNINGVPISPTTSNNKIRFIWICSPEQYFDLDFTAILTDTPPIRVTFPDEIGTVYGGTLDAISGELIVDTIKIAVDGSADWAMLSPGIYSLLGSIDNACVNTKLSKYRSNMYPFRGTGETKSSGLDKDGYFYIQSSVDRIWVYDSNYSTLADFKAFLNENPLELTYPTTAITTYQLPANEVKTLLTTNIITSDAGAVTVTYDDKDYTDLIASRRRILMETPHSNYLSGPAVAFNTNMAAKLKNLTVGIDPVQAGSGDPSPDNVRVITGWTGCNITKCGKNIFDKTIMKDQAAWNTIKFYAPVGATLTMSTNEPNPGGSGLLVYLRLPNESQSNSNKVYSGHSVTRTVTDAGYVEVLQRRASGEESFQDYQYQIEVGSTATEFEPYNSSIVNIDWTDSAGTVYGSTLDVTTGALTVDRAMVDLGDINWNIPESQNGYAQSAAVSNMRGTESAATVANIVCNKYKPDTQNHVYQRTTDKTIAITATSTNNNIRLYDTDLAGMDAAQYKAAVAGTVLVYHIISPVTYQLTPTQVKTLLGNNTIYADTGDVELTYWKH